MQGYILIKILCLDYKFQIINVGHEQSLPHM